MTRFVKMVCRYPSCNRTVQVLPGSEAWCGDKAHRPRDPNLMKPAGEPSTAGQARSPVASAEQESPV